MCGGHIEGGAARTQSNYLGFWRFVHGGITHGEGAERETLEHPAFLAHRRPRFYVEKAATLCGIDAAFARDEGLGPLLSNARAACGLESVAERNDDGP